jgi:membrane-bound lytic murein transglycosylase F
MRNFYPNLARAFRIGDPEPLAWVFPKGGDPVVMTQAREFFLRIINDGTLRQLMERYYGHVQRLDQMDIANFLERMRTVLPRYRTMFKRAQEASGIDWRLLAALGFQESHWEPTAVSPTGVRGLMMLTNETADRMGVTDRLDPTRRSAPAPVIDGAEGHAGAHQSPTDLSKRLAAYNVGYGHLERTAGWLAQSDPDLWVDVKRMLPLLSAAGAPSSTASAAAARP